jgi:hypothetical protein
LQSARLQGLFLNGSVLPGLQADRLVTRGGVYLRGAEVTGEVRLPGAQIDGDLDCDGAKITNAGGGALNADGAKVTGVFFLRKGAKIDGVLDLTAAELGTINDDPSCWPAKTGDLILDRCRYGAFLGHGVNAAERIRWLALQDPAKYDREFAPSAYEQCATVFSEMGHLADAKDILIEKEKLQRADRRKRAGNTFVKAGLWLGDAFLAWTVRYGQKSLFALLLLAGLWVVGTVAFYYTWQADAFKPNNAFVLRAPEWVGCSLDAQPYAFRKDTATASQFGCFLDQPEAKGFPEFNVWVYTLDVLFPLVDLEQQVHWVPDEDVGCIGGFAKWMVYIEIFMGWLLSLLAVAGLSGLIKSD